MMVTKLRLGYKYDVYPDSNHVHKVCKGFEIPKVAATFAHCSASRSVPLVPPFFLSRSTDEVVNSLVTGQSILSYRLVSTTH
jgi:hypothetical protein